jgi:putative transcriptional regulator
MRKNYNLLMGEDFLELTGRILVSSPCKPFNEMFNKSIIYIVSYNQDGAIGLIINQKMNHTPSILMVQNIFDKQFNLKIPISISIGGPNEPNRGFIVHSCEYQKNVLFQYENKLAISSNIDILRDVENGVGPQDIIFIMGYTVWNQGKLEEEIRQNYWLISDFHQDLIFSKNIENKWEESLRRIGIKESMFSPYSGKA